MKNLVKDDILVVHGGSDSGDRIINALLDEIEKEREAAEERQRLEDQIKALEEQARANEQALKDL